MCILSCKCNKYSNLFPKNTIKFLPTGEHFGALLFPEVDFSAVGEHFGAFLFPEATISLVGEQFRALLFPERGSYKKRVWDRIPDSFSVVC